MLLQFSRHWWMMLWGTSLTSYRLPRWHLNLFQIPVRAWNQVRHILQRLLENGLFVNREKCEFHVSTVAFLGYIIEQGDQDPGGGSGSSISFHGRRALRAMHRRPPPDLYPWLRCGTEGMALHAFWSCQLSSPPTSSAHSRSRPWSTRFSVRLK